MTLWIDRRAEFAPGLAATHVLIIATSVYRHLPGGTDPAPETIPTLKLEQLHSACAGAFAFARWLRDEYHDPDSSLATVRVLLAPSEAELTQHPELAQAANTCDVPTRENVQRALLDWQADCRNNPRGVAMLYASGHGIEFTPLDHSVLLHDFAATQLIADNTLAVGSVFRGMAGPTYPARQLYFVDACRSQPEELVNWFRLGCGAGLAELSRVEDRRCAPIFSGAAPGTLAFGERGIGTLFSQALLECFSGLAAEIDADGHSRVTTFSLGAALTKRVEKLAADCGRHQLVSTSGLINLGVLHYFRMEPAVDYTFEIRPGIAYPHAYVELTAEGGRRVVRGMRFPGPELVHSLPLGTYALDVGIDSGQPYFPQRGLFCMVLPQRRKLIDVEKP